MTFTRYPVSKTAALFRMALTLQFLSMSLAQSSVNKINYNDRGDDDDDISNDSEDEEPEWKVWRDSFFHYFRFGLFIFIICFPCIRGFRVWYLAGGRVLFRRTAGTDENGRPNGWIIGLRYQPADLERWLILTGYRAHSVGGNGESDGLGNGRARKLTPDEVYALPEISAKVAEDDDDLETGIRNDELAVTYHGNAGSNTIDNNNNNNGKNTNTDSDSSDLNSPDDRETDSTSVATTTITSSELSSSASQREATPISTTPQESSSSTDSGTVSTTAALFTTTMSTSCSICIDDFEDGETIRLLPRCGHAFHTECILPWLTERQGCCPCCKAPVICPNASEEAKENENTENGNRNEDENDIEEEARENRRISSITGQGRIPRERTLNSIHRSLRSDNNSNNNLSARRDVPQNFYRANPFVMIGTGRLPTRQNRREAPTN